jgi:hypothetical protein
MAMLTNPRAGFEAALMTYMSPADSVYPTPTGPGGPPMKRARAMKTTTTSVDSSFPFKEFGSQAVDPRNYHHGATTHFTPVTAVVSEADVSLIAKHGDMIRAGTVLDSMNVLLKGQPMGAHIPLPLVSDALCTNHKKGGKTIVRASFTVAAEGRAMITSEYLDADCKKWKEGDHLVWMPGTLNIKPMEAGYVPWKLKKATEAEWNAYHAIVYNTLVGGQGPSGYVMVFIASLG